MRVPFTIVWHGLRAAVGRRDRIHDKIVWGWSQSFRHTTAKHVFEQLDKEIDKRIMALQTEAHRLVPTGETATRRRVMGVHLLADTCQHPLPEINLAQSIQ